MSLIELFYTKKTKQNKTWHLVANLGTVSEFSLFEDAIDWNWI